MSIRIEGRLRRGDLMLDLDVELPVGVTAITGPNGAGKTSVLRLIAGLEALDDGHLVIDDVVVDDHRRRVWVPPERRDVSMAFQQPRLFPHLAALHNIAYPLRRHGHSAGEAARLAGPFASLVGADAFLDLRPHQLSGGQAQRTAIAAAMAAGASTILLDEPLASIDDASRTQLRRLLHEIDVPRLVWVTHDPADSNDADHHVELGLH